MSKSKRSGVLTDAMFSLFEWEGYLDLDPKQLAAVYATRLMWLYDEHQDMFENSTE